MGFPRSKQTTIGSLGSLCSPVVLTSMTREKTALVPHYMPFGSSLLPVSSACAINDVYQAFTFVNHAARP